MHGDTTTHKGIDKRGMDLGNVSVASHFEDEGSTWLETGVDGVYGGLTSRGITEDPVEGGIGDSITLVQEFAEM